MPRAGETDPRRADAGNQLSPRRSRASEFLFGQHVAAGVGLGVWRSADTVRYRLAGFGCWRTGTPTAAAQYSAFTHSIGAGPIGGACRSLAAVEATSLAPGRGQFNSKRDRVLVVANAVASYCLRFEGESWRPSDGLDISLDMRTLRVSRAY